MREATRVLQRIARVATKSPEVYKEGRVKDYNIFITGSKYGKDELRNLPTELHHESVYTRKQLQEGGGVLYKTFTSL